MTSTPDRRTAQLLDQLADAVEAHRDPEGTPVRDIAAEAGVGTMVVQRFLSGQGSIALRSFVALARWAGYDVTLTPARKQ